MDHTQHLSNFLSSLQYSSLPLSVVTAAKLSILNALGCGLGYALHASANKTFSYIQRTQPQEASGTILGRPQRTSIENAALINGIAITTADFDDTHLRTVIHPSGTPLAALLALAERYPLTGEDFLLAFIAGVECQLAIGNAISPAHYKDGWHITGTTGTFGATAAVAKALKLDAKQFASALGHASSMAGGTRAMFGTDTKTLHMGRGAQNGLLAAELARDGFGSAERAIESWARLVSNAVKEDQISALADEGKERRWQILENTFKPYPCGIVIHPLIDAGIACHEWLVEEDVAVPIEQIQSIEATVNPQCVPPMQRTASADRPGDHLLLIPRHRERDFIWGGRPRTILGQRLQRRSHAHSSRQGQRDNT